MQHPFLWSAGCMSSDTYTKTNLNVVFFYIKSIVKTILASASAMVRYVTEKNSGWNMVLMLFLTANALVIPASWRSNATS